MKSITALLKKLKGMHRLSKFSVGLGFTLMTLFYIVAAAARLLAPNAGDYLRAMSIHYGALEAAPAFLVVGVCAGLLGDLMLRRRD